MVSMEEISFQLRFICLNYIKDISSRDSTFHTEDLSKFHIFLDDKLTKCDNEQCEDYLGIVQSLCEMSSCFDSSLLATIETTAETLLQGTGTLSREKFEKATTTILQRCNVETWDEVALLFHLVYYICKNAEISNRDEIFNLTFEYLRNALEDFIVQHGGWQKASTDTSMEQSQGILSSIIMIQKDETYDEEENESLDSATPPEIVDRPPMTASLVQMMGGDSATLGGNSNGNTGTSSDSNEYELIGSTISISTPVPASPKSPPPVSPAPKVKTPSPPPKTPPEVEEIISEPAEIPSLSDESSITDYLPHISLGVAAAAACIGFFVLKKAS